MTAAVFILCGPSGSGKTRRLLDRFRSLAATSAGAALWLGPNRRTIDALRERLLADGPSHLALNLCTLQEVAEQIIGVNDPAAQPLTHVQRRLLLDDLVAELHQGNHLSHFQPVIDTRGFAEGLHALVAELKRNEVWPDHLLRAVQEPGLRNRKKVQQLAQVYDQYQRCLIEQHRFDLEGRYWYARDLLTRGHRRPFERVRAVFVDGFTDFTRTQHEMLEALARSLTELWITLPNEPGDERTELFTRTRRTLAGLQSLTPNVEYLPPPAASPQDGSLPSGLQHVERQLFQPIRNIQPSDQADGIRCLEAPGQLGEARMVAREIKSLLLEGVRAEDILVTLREVPPYADLIQEVFGEYGIPIDVEGTEPLLHNAAVTTLLRAARLPDDDWPFAGVTALLRSNYFQPEWPEFAAETAQRAEALLRLLGEPRGRDAYLRALDLWANQPQPGLEDEQAEESRRRKKHELAKLCQPFLHHFFRAWDEAPARVTLTKHVRWLQCLADELGIRRMANEDARDRAAMDRLWDELERWSRLEASLPEGGRPRERVPFFRMVTALAAEAGLARTQRGPGRVRVLSADLARNLCVPYLFVMGLGERGFPRLAAPEPLFDEAERQAFKQAGLQFSCLDDRLPDEMLLFYQVVTRAQRQLVLSYPAVDEKGQSLLPSSFLQSFRECFAKTAIETRQRRMLIERYDTDPPMAPSEHRVQMALQGATWPEANDLSANLATAARMVQHRFHEPEFTPYDGRLRHATVLTDLRALYGPEKVFSPTALETYIACPFHFFLEQVLHLEPLEEPREEIEQTRRGSAFHRALARLHQQLIAAEVHQPSAEVNEQLLVRLEEAVEEYVARAPSPASKELWRLEGQRLRRSAARYESHWRQFLAPWRALGIQPRPHLLEAEFGQPAATGVKAVDALLIRVDDLEVRVGGRIDRIDIVDLPEGVGFWVIDYKTGRAAHYSGPDLREFRRLQLTLYALAVERVILAPNGARPLGLAYWLVTDTGPKPVLPAGKQLTAWNDDGADWRRVREQLERWVATLVANIRQGVFPLKPRSEKCTETCEFAQVCRISQSRAWVEHRAWQLPLPVLETP